LRLERRGERYVELGIVRRQLWNGGARRWGYVLDEGQLADLGGRYGG
jgi:hypothetical protein